MKITARKFKTIVDNSTIEEGALCTQIPVGEKSTFARFFINNQFIKKDRTRISCKYNRFFCSIPSCNNREQKKI